MRNSVSQIALAALAFVCLTPAIAFADPAIGSACSPDGVITRTGGAETSGVGAQMVCVGSVWVSTVGYDGSGNASVTNAFSLRGDITPTALAANTDDWAPTGLAGASVIRMAGTAARDLTGLTGGADGRIITLLNVGSFTITLKDSVTSTAANQFALTADIPVATDESVTLIYDATASRWKQVAKGSATAGGGAATIDDLTDAFTDYVTNHNFIQGRASAAALTSGAIQNTYVGEAAGATTANSTATTDSNTAVGYRALPALTTGAENTAIGTIAAQNMTTGGQNTAIGHNALTSLVGGNYNVALGMSAMCCASGATFSSNTALGTGVMANTTTGSGENVGVGHDAMIANTTGNANTVMGYHALYANQTGSGNTVIGYKVGGTTLNGGSGNILIGTSQFVDTPTAGTSNYLNIGNALTGDISTGYITPTAGFGLLGDITPAALAANTNDWAPTGLAGASVIRMAGTAARDLTGLTGGADGRIVTLINVGANTITLKDSATSTATNQFALTADLPVATDETVTLIYDSTASRWKQVAKGSATAAGVTDLNGLTDVFTDYATEFNIIGGRAGAAALTSGASGNTFWGMNAGPTPANSTSATDDNIGIGRDALTSLTSGYRNVAMGVVSLSNLTSGNENTAIGASAMYFNTGNANTGVGSYSLSAVSMTGGTNSALGFRSLNAITSGSDNVGVGAYAGYGIGNGNANTAVGVGTLYVLASGATNVALGYNSFQQLTSGSGNLALGSSTGSTQTSGGGNIIIGNDIDLPIATGSSQLNIGNIIYGTGIDGSDNVLSTGNIGIGTKTPGAKFDNAGSIALSGDITPTALAANTNDWAPTGLANASVIRMAGTAARDLTGLTGGADGRIITLINIGTFTITLKNSVTSTAANQFLFTADLPIAQHESATIMYDSTALRWKLLAKGTATASGGATTIDGLTDAFVDYATNNNLIMGRVGATALTAGALSNVFIGEDAGATSANSTANTDYNVAVGHHVLNSLTSGDRNTAIGSEMMTSTTTGSSNVATGFGALYSNVDGNTNIALGIWALNSNVSGNSNIAIGHTASFNNRGSANVAVGSGALNESVGGDQSVAIGFAAMWYANNASASFITYNTAVGAYALQGSAAAAANTGIRNTALGHSAMMAATSGSNNVVLGTGAGDTITSGSNNIAIGYGADTSSPTASNEMNIGNALYGTGIIDGTTRRIGINKPAPVAGLDVGTDLALSGDITPTALAANTDNWAPTGLATASVIRMAASAAYNLTGLTGGVDGRVLTLMNVGTFVITLVDESASSTAANRFALTGNLTLSPDQATMIVYDSTSSRWRVDGGDNSFAIAPAAETVAAAATITANACGTVKLISATVVGVVTNTTNTFTSPTAAYAGCCMDVLNTSGFSVTLDANAKFKTATGGNLGLGTDDSVRVCSNGTNWYQTSAVLAAQ